MTGAARIWTAALFLALISALAVLPAVASTGAQAERPLLVSRADGAKGAVAKAASLKAVSADATRIVFDSTPLGGDANGGLYLRDVRRHTTTRLGDRGGDAALSADGSLLILSGEGIFARHLPGGRQQRVAPVRSGQPSLSADGRVLAFTSSNGGLTVRGEDQVFVRDIRGGGPVQVSRASGTHGQLADGESEEPAISADGRFVAFVSQAHNLAGGREDGYVSAVYLRNLVTDRTVRVSPRGMLASTPSISANGDRVVFAALDSVYMFERRSGDVAIVASGGPYTPDVAPSISADGRYVAYRAALPVAGIKRLAITDVRTRKTARLAEVGLPEGGSGPIAFSANGRFIVFDTHTEGLVGPQKDFRESGGVYLLRNPLLRSRGNPR